MKIVSPYKETGRWLKGNLHAHTINSPCGHYPLEEVIGTYGDRILNYDFLAITDHQQLTEVPTEGPNGMVVFSGTEYKKEDYQTLGINISCYKDDSPGEFNQQGIFDEVIRQGGLNIICHPHFKREDYWPLEKLLGLEGYAAVEIYNHNVKMNNAGRAVATDLWDALLSAGRRVWGVASDDFHHRSRYGGGFIMVEAPPAARPPMMPAILDAIRAGAFYASSGILLDGIRAEGDTISVATATPRVPEAEFTFIGKGGAVLARIRGSEAAYRATGGEGYVRVEAAREDGARAWTQPFYME